MISRNYVSVLLALSVPAYYYLHYRPTRVKHDSELAKAFCKDYVKNYIGCIEKGHLNKCSKEMLKLHNCVYTQKGFNQQDMEFL